MTDKYKEEVIGPGDRASALAKEVCFKSHGNSPALTIIPHQHQPGNFRGPVGFLWNKDILEDMMRTSPMSRHWTVTEEVENDGAGGKPQFHTLIGTPEVFRGLGWEIIAMTADDFARSGRLPVVIDNEINTKAITKENFHLFQAMMEGYGDALRQTNLVNITGEVAIMKDSITSFCDTGEKKQLILTWGASCLGLARKGLLIDGSRIRSGMPIIGFWEPGYRCNGGGFFTNLLDEVFGLKNVANNCQALSFIRKLTVPSVSYAKTICRLIGWLPDGTIQDPLANIMGIAHITGGGVWGKFGELLPERVGAVLDSMPEPAEVLLEAQELSWNTSNRLTDYQAYGTLHGGCGMLLVADCHDDIDPIIEEAKKDGIKADLVGETTGFGTSEVIIHSRFKEEKILSSEDKE